MRKPKAEFDERLDLDFEKEESVGEDDSKKEDDVGIAPFPHPLFLA